MSADNTALIDGQRRTSTIKRLVGMSEFSVFIALVAMFIIMCFASPYFLRMNNIWGRGLLSKAAMSFS